MSESASRPDGEIPHEVHLYWAQKNIGRDAAMRAFSSEEEAYKAADARIARAKAAAAEAVSATVVTGTNSVRSAAPGDGILWI